MTAYTSVRARIDPQTKVHAETALRAMGLSMSDAIRLLLFRIAAEKRLPFAAQVPKARKKSATDALERGGGKRISKAGDLFKDLGI